MGGRGSRSSPPRVTHHPLAPRARAEDQAAAKPSSSGQGARAEVPGRRSEKHPTAQGEGRGAGGGGGRGACRGGRLGRHSWRIRFPEVEPSLGEKFGFFLLILCDVTSPAPWRSSGERRFLLTLRARAKEGQGVNYLSCFWNFSSWAAYLIY